MKRILSLLTAVILLLSFAPVCAAGEEVRIETTAEIEKIDKHGNIVLEASCESAFSAGLDLGDIVTVSFLGKEMDMPFCSNFSDVDSGTYGVFALEGNPNLKLAINMSNFAVQNGIAVKETFPDKTFQWSASEGISNPVEFTITLKTKGGYYEEYIMHQLSYTDNREDYPELSDEQFANFREIKTTGIAPGRLYRSCSPVDPKHSRNAYSDAAISKAGISVVMNLANDEASVKAFPGYSQSYYATAKHIALNTVADVSSEEFKSRLAEGLRFFIENNGIYLVHCTEGKDRAGFVAAILECLTGATPEEVVNDYMVSYTNYYGVTKEDVRYRTIASGNIEKILTDTFGLTDLYSADLAECAKKYLSGIGLSEAEIKKLCSNLSEPAPEAVHTNAKEPSDTDISSVSGKEYTVMWGDTLYELALRFCGNGEKYKELARANKILNPDCIFTGQKLIIPDM